MTKENQEIEIDLKELALAIWRRLWLVILALLIGAGTAFAGTYYLITPLYTSTAKLYVNNSEVSIGGAKLDISSADIMASQSLVDTYIVIMDTRTCLEEVIEVADLDYTYSELRKMITATAVNGTEVFQISAESPDPAEAKLIANTIADILPEKIAEIMDGSSARIVDYAVASRLPSSPNYLLNTVLGGLLGIVLSCLCILLQMLSNEIIGSEEDITRSFDLPILTVIPDVRASKADNAYHNSYRKREQYRQQVTKTAQNKTEGGAE